MYCRYCGKEMVEGAAVCVQCGAPAGAGAAYCPFCGSATAPGAVVCIACGRALNAPNIAPGQVQKSKLAAGLLGLLLSLFIGNYGVHNFYLGYTGRAITQLVLTIIGVILIFCGAGLGAFITLPVGIGGIVEGIMLLTGGINKDGKGIPLK